MNPSPFNWQTGQPSVFAPLQSAATVARKASEHNARKIAAGNFNEPLVAKKSTRKPEMPKQRLPRSGKTKPLIERLDFDEVREYRLLGKSWADVAERFGCSKKAINYQSIARFPELRGTMGKTPGAKPTPLPLDVAVAAMKDGGTLRGVAQAMGIPHSSLRNRLLKWPGGLEVLALAKARAEAMNQAAAKAASERARMVVGMLG